MKSFGKGMKPSRNLPFAPDWRRTLVIPSRRSRSCSNIWRGNCLRRIGCLFKQNRARRNQHGVRRGLWRCACDDLVLQPWRFADAGGFVVHHASEVPVVLVDDDARGTRARRHRADAGRLFPTDQKGAGTAIIIRLFWRLRRCKRGWT